jgi:hypothetical protein
MAGHTFVEGLIAAEALLVTEHGVDERNEDEAQEADADRRRDSADCAQAV